MRQLVREIHPRTETEVFVVAQMLATSSATHNAWTSTCMGASLLGCPETGASVFLHTRRRRAVGSCGRGRRCLPLPPDARPVQPHDRPVDGHDSSCAWSSIFVAAVEERMTELGTGV